jgi:thiol-disulfide isomerase/thioredoxin
MKLLKNLILLAAFFSVCGLANAQDLKPLKEDVLNEILAESNNKIVVINLWAFWCQPCKEEFPELVKFGETNKDKAKLVLISLDDKADLETKTKPFLVKNNVNYTSYYNDFDKDEKLIKALDENWEGAIPSTFFFKNGKLVKSLVGKQTEKDFQKAYNEIN